MKLLPRAAVLQAVNMFMLATIIGTSVNFFHPNKVAYLLQRPPIETVPDTLLAQSLPDVVIVDQQEIDESSFDPLTFEPKIVNANQVLNLMTTHSAILLDARSPAKFKYETIPSAINLPIDELSDYEAILEKLPKDKWLICFCDDAACDLGEMLAMELVNYEFRHIVYFKGGLEEWKQIGQNTTGGNK